MESARYSHSYSPTQDAWNHWLQISHGQGRAKTCLMPYANNKDADQPAQTRILISAFVIRSLDSIISLVSRSEISRF